MLCLRAFRCASCCAHAVRALQKSDEIVTQDVVLFLPAACLLVPTTVKMEDYTKLVSAPAQPFYDEKCTITVPGDSSVDDVITSVGSVFRAYVVQQTSRATILFAKSFQGHLVTALLKPGDGSIAVTFKSTCAGHAAAMTRDVLAIVSPGDLPPPLPAAPVLAAPPILAAGGESLLEPVAQAETASLPPLLEFVPPPAPTRTYLRDPSVSIDDIDPMAGDDTTADAAAAADASNVEDFLKDDDEDGPASAADGGDEDAPIGISSRVAVVAGEEEED